LHGGNFRTHALDDTPRLLEGSGYAHNIVDLIAPGESSTVEKYYAASFPLEEFAGDFQHGVQAEIVLPGRVVNFLWRQKRVPDLIFAQQPAAGARRQLASERSLARARKASHEHNHVE
jgi:hypothetical protein